MKMMKAFLVLATLVAFSASCDFPSEWWGTMWYKTPSMRRQTDYDFSWSKSHQYISFHQLRDYPEYTVLEYHFGMLYYRNKTGFCLKTGMTDYTTFPLSVPHGATQVSKEGNVTIYRYTSGGIQSTITVIMPECRLYRLERVNLRNTDMAFNATFMRLGTESEDNWVIRHPQHCVLRNKADAFLG